MTDHLRFVFSYRHQIQDRSIRAGVGRRIRTVTDDYAIISRIPNSKTGEILITAAGIGQAGTRAAGEFLTSPEDIDSLLLAAPRGGQEESADTSAHFCHQRIAQSSGCDRHVLLVRSQAVLALLVSRRTASFAYGSMARQDVLLWRLPQQSKVGPCSSRSWKVCCTPC